jgi:hypothetical protein
MFSATSNTESAAGLFDDRIVYTALPPPADVKASRDRLQQGAQNKENGDEQGAFASGSFP